MLDVKFRVKKMSEKDGGGGGLLKKDPNLYDKFKLWDLLKFTFLFTHF